MSTLRPARFLRFLIPAAFLALVACAATPPPAPGLHAAAATGGEDQIVILVGLDGLRYDAIDRFPEAAPNLRAMAKRGVRAASLTPVMPSVTFVNFYSIATGLYPEHTGVVSNSTYSRSLGRVMARAEHGSSEWWGGEPIWATAEKQGVHAGTMFWLGSEAEISGVRPTYWLPYDHQKPFDERTDEVLDWLARPAPTTPRLVTIYFHAVDSAVHVFGLDSEEERAAIAEVDRQVGALVDGVAALGLSGRANFIVLSDHGMTAAPPSKIFMLDEYLDIDAVFVPEFEGPDGAGRAPLIHIFADDDAIGPVYSRLAAGALTAPFSVFRRENLPERWRLDNPDRTGDIVVVADEGWVLFSKRLVAKYPPAPHGATHGYDRHLQSMGATFIADGPRFADHRVVEPFDNVEVYGIIAEILGLAPAPTDGDIDRVRHFLTPAE